MNDEHRDKVTKGNRFYQKQHPFSVYNFLFYRRRIEVMVKRRDC